jgi:hypothetical protein
MHCKTESSFSLFHCKSSRCSNAIFGKIIYPHLHYMTLEPNLKLRIWARFQHTRYEQKRLIIITCPGKTVAFVPISLLSFFSSDTTMLKCAAMLVSVSASATCNDVNKLVSTVLTKFQCHCHHTVNYEFNFHKVLLTLIRTARVHDTIIFSSCGLAK